MSMQITVRLENDDVEYIDRRVAADHASGRAAIVAAGIHALREQEIVEAMRASYLLHGEDPDMVELAKWSAAQRGIVDYPADGDNVELEY